MTKVMELFKKRSNSAQAIVCPERRLKDRTQVALPLKVNGTITGRTINISDSGLCFMVGQPIAFENMIITIGPVEGEFQVVWKDEQRDEHTFVYGGLFTVLNS